MEQGPHLFYDRQETSGESPPDRQNSPERLLPTSERPARNHEALPTSKTFEQMVHEALEEELKFERDPALRDQAARRADEILAEFQEAKQMQNGASGQSSGASASDDSSDELTSELADKLGIKQKKSDSRPDRPVYPGASLNFGAADLAMAAVIGILLIVVILLLIF